MHSRSRRRFLVSATWKIATIQVSSVLLQRQGAASPIVQRTPSSVESRLAASVSASRFGATGDGRTDDTHAIQAALDSGALLVVLENGEFRISAPLRLAPGQTLTCRSGTIRALARKQGSLSRTGEHIVLARESVLEAVTILPPTPGFDFDGSPKRIVRLAGDRARVLRCRIERGELPAHASIDTGISILEPVDYCVIDQNELIGCGIQYAGGGARYTSCTGNRLSRPIGNGITGTGNNPRRSSIGHQLLDNEVIGALRMGIEEQSRPFDSPPSQISGTLIRRNLVVGGPSAEYFGISAVGEDSLVQANRIVNWPGGYALELGSELGAIAEDNHISWSEGQANRSISIAINPIRRAGGGTPVQLRRNTIENAFWGVSLHEGSLIMSDNFFVNIKRRVFEANPGAKTFVRATANQVTFSQGGLAGEPRVVFGAHGPGVYSRNRILYRRGSVIPSTADRSFFVSGHDVVISENEIRVEGEGRIVGITAHGTSPRRVSCVGNLFIGSVSVNFAGIDELEVRENVVGGADIPPRR